MWGRATLATEVSTISMMAGSMTVMVTSHLLTCFSFFSSMYMRHAPHAGGLLPETLVVEAASWPRTVSDRGKAVRAREGAPTVGAVKGRDGYLPRITSSKRFPV